MYDERARAANYAGPTETPLTLSRADRDYIVQFYSRSIPAAGTVYVTVNESSHTYSDRLQE